MERTLSHTRQTPATLTTIVCNACFATASLTSAAVMTGLASGHPWMHTGQLCSLDISMEADWTNSCTHHASCPAASSASGCRLWAPLHTKPVWSIQAASHIGSVRVGQVQIGCASSSTATVLDRAGAKGVTLHSQRQRSASASIRASCSRSLLKSPAGSYPGWPWLLVTPSCNMARQQSCSSQAGQSSPDRA